MFPSYETVSVDTILIMCFGLRFKWTTLYMCIYANYMVLTANYLHNWIDKLTPRYGLQSQTNSLCGSGSQTYT